MSSVKIEGNASGTGIFTIASPNSNTNRTLTLPDVTGTFNTSGGVNEVPAGSASAPSIFFTSDSNTGMWSPAADTVAWTTGGSERMRIDSSGNVGIGTSSPVYNLDVSAASDTNFGLRNSSSVTSGNRGTITWLNSSASSVAYIRATAVTDNVGTDLSFATRPAAGSLTERMRIDSSGNLLLNTTTLDGGFTCNKTASFAGNIYPTVDNNGWNCGTAAKRWSTIFAVTGTINTSDANQKQDIASLDETEKRVAVAIKSLIKKYRFKDAVVKKGDEARIHVGVIAQEVQAAFVAEGLDANRYALFCSDTWVDEETNEQKTRLGVRYDELLAFVIAAI